MSVPLLQLIPCQYCGQWVAFNAPACQRCGGAVTQGWRQHQLNQWHAQHGVKPKKSKEPVVIALGVVGMLIACGVLGVIGKSSKSSSGASDEPKKPPIAHHLKTRDAIDAWTMAETFVKKSLKSPSTADFGSVFGDYQKPEEACERDSGEVWVCKGWVDAQNSFGAKVRTNFVIKMEYLRDEDETWKVLSGPFLTPR